ncbi:MAG: iron ABC transporter permease, partial [Comamonadaceae bacterium]
MKARTAGAAVAGVLLLIALAVASLSVGSTALGWRDALAALAGPWAAALGWPAPGEMAQTIVRDLRLPRLLLALLVGAALAVV